MSEPETMTAEEYRRLVAAEPKPSKYRNRAEVVDGRNLPTMRRIWYTNPIEIRGPGGAGHTPGRGTKEATVVQGKYTPDEIARFWSAVDRSGDCWLWMKSRGRGGYGRFSVHSGHSPAHRVAYELAKGEIPDGLLVCHSCDNPPCVNPAHLWLGTQVTNAIDMASKGRQVFQKRPELAPRGERNGTHTRPQSLRRGDDHWTRRMPERIKAMPGEAHPNARLTRQQVAEMRGRYARGGVTQALLAREYGVSFQHVHDIVRGKKWAGDEQVQERPDCS